MKSTDFLAWIVPTAKAPSSAAVEHAAEAAGLSQHFACGPLIFFGAPGNALLRLPAGSGLVWGSLFTAEGRSVRSIATPTADALVRGEGSALTDKFWGSYLGLLIEGPAVTVIRDPSGFIPCYYSASGDGILLASNARLAADTGLASATLDWDEILSQLQYYSLRSARTALRDLREIVPGTACRIDDQSVSERTLWSPARHAQGWDRRATVSDGAAKVRGAILTTIAAQSRHFVKPMVQLSGGLDSSIVTAALAAVGSDAVCVTFRGGAADLDERAYAAAVAAKAGFPLLERSLDLSLIDLNRSMAEDLPRPTGRSFSQADDRQARMLAEELGCDAFFTGGGGDNVFWYQNTVSPGLDRLRCGNPVGALGTLWDLAAMCEVPRRTAFAIALRKIGQRRPRPWPHDLTFLAPAFQQLARPYQHPWLPDGTDMLPGVRAYIRGLIQMQDHFEYYCRAELAPIVAPPLAQPVVEACLRVPSWLWCEDGHNRAVARAAFADLLPAEVAYRRTKGGFNGFNHQLLERQRGLVREMLLDGQLRRQGLLDASAIEAVLHGGRPVSDTVAGRLLRFVSVEAWLQSWAAVPAGARSASQRRY